VAGSSPGSTAIPSCITPASLRPPTGGGADRWTNGWVPEAIPERRRRTRHRDRTRRHRRIAPRHPTCHPDRTGCRRRIRSIYRTLRPAPRRQRRWTRLPERTQQRRRTCRCRCSSPRHPTSLWAGPGGVGGRVHRMRRVGHRGRRAACRLTRRSPRPGPVCRREPAVEDPGERRRPIDAEWVRAPLGRADPHSLRTAECEAGGEPRAPARSSVRALERRAA
jgi:hypothetical protein